MPARLPAFGGPLAGDDFRQIDWVGEVEYPD